jgi:hypothetical protein
MLMLNLIMCIFFIDYCYVHMNEYAFITLNV